MRGWYDVEGQRPRAVHAGNSESMGTEEQDCSEEASRDLESTPGENRTKVEIDFFFFKCVYLF